MSIADRRFQLSEDIAKGLHRAPADRQIFLIDRSDEALAELAGWAALEITGAVLPPLAGTVLSVKSCFDMAGWVTSSASASTADDKPATEDAATLAMLRAAGATVIGQTNMTEFAYGALGVNSRFGTPRSPLDPAGARVAGGSTSGGAVAAATGLADLSLGSDTSGSARIPAAFCGCFGFKPSMGRYPREGMHFLSRSFDVPGLLAADLTTIIRADEVLTGEVAQTPPRPRSLRLAIPRHLSDLDMDAEIRSAFAAFIAALTARGVQVDTIPLPAMAESAAITASGGIIAAEAHAIHAARLSARFDDFDPLVGARVLRGKEVPAHDYVAACWALETCRRQFDAQLAGFDGVLTPTTPILAPRLSDIADMDSYLATNIRAFSLTEYANRLELPSISLPLRPLPAGIMLTGRRGSDAQTLAQARLLAEILATSPLIDI